MNISGKQVNCHHYNHIVAASPFIAMSFPRERARVPQRRKPPHASTVKYSRLSKLMAIKKSPRITSVKARIHISGSVACWKVRNILFTVVMLTLDEGLNEVKF